ncbi:MAG TPA: preprotein translocase subunit SecG [Candidatus Paceibacterota bacterium]
MQLHKTKLARIMTLVLLLGVQMEALVSALPYAEIVLGILLIIGIVLQQRGASLGGAFGGDNFASSFYKRRGAEKFLFNATIVIAILLVLLATTNFLLVGS